MEGGFSFGRLSGGVVLQGYRLAVRATAPLERAELIGLAATRRVFAAGRRSVGRGKPHLHAEADTPSRRLFSPGEKRPAPRI